MYITITSMADVLAFVLAAAPWIILAVGVAVLTVCGVSEDKEGARRISFSMSIGIAVGGLGALLRIWDMMYGLSLGLLVGMLVGFGWSKLAR